MPRKIISRREVLRAAGVSIPLPLLDAMFRPGQANAGEIADLRKRLVLVGLPLGLHAPHFFPEDFGQDFTSSRYLQCLEATRGNWTVFSGMSHRYSGGHGSRSGLMTGVAPENMRPNKKKRNTISLDQEVAARSTRRVRYPSLAFGRSGLSWNANGTVVPSESDAVKVYQRLFIDGTEAEQSARLAQVNRGRSILDGVQEQAASISRGLGSQDSLRMNLMMDSIREAEKSLMQRQDWVNTPKPDVDVQPFTDSFSGAKLIERQRQWYSLIRLALMTDSTRVISMDFYSHSTVSIGGEKIGHHDASHHGKRPEKIEQLSAIEEAEMRALGDFLKDLHDHIENGCSLLDQTQVLVASDLGNASAHTTTNLPVLLAGGGFKHAGHVGFDPKNNTRLSNLFVRMLQQLGIASDRFGSSDGIVTDI